MLAFMDPSQWHVDRVGVLVGQKSPTFGLWKTCSAIFADRCVRAHPEKTLHPILRATMWHEKRSMNATMRR
jgi:hypothetical protein